MCLCRLGATSTSPAPLSPHLSNLREWPGDTTTSTFTGAAPTVFSPKIVQLFQINQRRHCNSYWEEEEDLQLTHVQVDSYFRFCLIMLENVCRAVPSDTGNYSCEPSNAEADTVQVHVLEGTGDHQQPFLCIQRINLEIIGRKNEQRMGNFSRQTWYSHQTLALF